MQKPQIAISAGTIKDLEAGYRVCGWQADDAIIKALSFVESPQALNAVSTAIRAVYLPWIEESALYLQKIVDGTIYPDGAMISSKPLPPGNGECLLFVDGLRFDAAKRLMEMLTDQGFVVIEKTTWAALPSITATAKAAVTPVRDKISGTDVSTDFEPSLADTGQSLKGGYHLKKLLAGEGWKILEGFDSGNGVGNAWCEFGNLDHEGHDRGWKLAKHIYHLLKEIRDRIIGLLAAGWKSVRVVTDHGWLLLPGGLPKIDMPAALTDNKWGRCASLKTGASTSARLFPWFWNPNLQFVLADGISCFRNGLEYAHGGLSLQECFMLELEVNAASDTRMSIQPAAIDVAWKGLRCSVTLNAPGFNLSLDIRRFANDPASSVVAAVRPLSNSGAASVLVGDGDLEGLDAFIVLLDSNAEPVVQIQTVIGGGES